MAVSQDEEAEDRYAREKMAAAAGAPGSGEGGGEAEPDSEPISGEERPAEPDGVPEQLGEEEGPTPLEGSETGHGGEGLRQPGVEGCAGPGQAEIAAGVPHASAWPLEPVGLSAEPSEMDTGDCRSGALLSTHEEPMQLGKDMSCPSDPCHGSPPSLGILEADGERNCCNLGDPISASLQDPTDLLYPGSTLPPHQPLTEEQMDESCPSAPCVEPSRDPSFMELHGESALLEVKDPPELKSPRPSPLQSEFEEPRSTMSNTPNQEEPRSISSPGLRSMTSPNLEEQRIPSPNLQEVTTTSTAHPEELSSTSTPHQEELCSTTSPTPNPEELRFTSSQTPNPEELSSTMSPTPNPEVLSSTSPTPNPEELSSTMSPTPNPEELSSTSSPTPNPGELSSTTSPTPYLEELSSTSTSTPQQEELSSTMSPTPNPEELSSTSSPTPNLEELSSTSTSTPQQEELSSTTSPTPNPEQLSSTSPTPNTEERSSTSIPQQEELSSMLSPTPNPEELSSMLFPTPSPEDLSSTASPTPKPEELSSTSSPMPNPEELRSTSSPTPSPEELRSTTSPTPNPEELSSSSSPGAEKLSPSSSPNPEELSSTLSPTPNSEELHSTSSPTFYPEQQRSTSSPTPHPEERFSTSSPITNPEEPWSELSLSPNLENPTSSSTSNVEGPVSSTLLQPQLMTKCTSDPINNEQVEQAVVPTELRQLSIPENVLQDPGLDTHGMAPPEAQGTEETPMDTLLEEALEVQQNCSLEAMDTQGPMFEVESKVDSEPMEVVLEPEVVGQVQDPVMNIMHVPVPEIVPLMEDSNHKVQEPISDLQLHCPASPVVGSEPEEVTSLPENPSLQCGPPAHMSEPVPENRDKEAFAKTVQTVFNSVHEPSREGLDLLESKMECVPEPLHKIPHELSAVSVEEKVLAETKPGVHPVTEQCAELGVEVKLFLQPALQTFDEGPNKEDLSSGFHLASHKTESDETSLKVVSKVKSILEPGNVLVETETAAASAVTTELKSLESEVDSFDPEPSVNHASEATMVDAECGPFCRDANREQKPSEVAHPNAASDLQLEEQQLSILSTDSAPLSDCREVEEPKPSSIDPGMEAPTDNRCKSVPEQVDLLGEMAELAPGSEVQVTLDHIIQDALVVSFRHGDRIFSGVLMDLSKRFGPHGIPVTIHPKREYKNKPEDPIQVQGASFQEDSTKDASNANASAATDAPPVPPSEPCGVHSLWTSKPPPLFHEGAPYPPPLFIRDTYNQSIPQPPPRKIKRLKKKIYREEPTSIMNAIKLRPRQVLCDKCKNVVADKKEVRKTGTDSFKLEEGKRRRHESVTTVNKKLKTDHKVNGKSQSESQKRSSVSKVTNLGHGRGKVVKVAPQTNAPKSQLHTKKVLQSKNMDHAKAREVLKMAKEKAQKKQKNASSSKNAHGHFTRRLQNTSSGTLPPRLRIKPQRYRNEENDSSLKIGLESLRSSKMGIKPQTRYPATRSAGEAPSNGPQEASDDIQTASVCEAPAEPPAEPPAEQDEQPALSKRASKSNITVYMTLTNDQTKADSSSASVCSSDSTDDLKSTHSECSSTENFDFPPGSMHASSSSSSKEEKKLSGSLKIKVFAKNVSKCVTPDGRTICVGDIVWAKIYGFPWWPARILTITVSRKDNGLLVRQEARISWFGSPTTSFLALSQLSPFLENFQSRFNKKRKGLYRKAITEAAKAAKQLTPEVRALLTQFET